MTLGRQSSFSVLSFPNLYDEIMVPYGCGTGMEGVCQLLRITTVLGKAYMGVKMLKG